MVSDKKIAIDYLFMHICLELKLGSLMKSVREISRVEYIGRIIFYVVFLSIFIAAGLGFLYGRYESGYFDF